MADDVDLQRELEEARATIAAQAMQMHRLESEAARGSALPALRELLTLSDVVGTTVGRAPYHALLTGITEAAKRLFNAGAASVLLLDEEANELIFEAATGGGDVIGLRIPAHQGIAGWVAMTGEPIAVGDVRRDPRWAKSFAESTGYVPQSILAVPMLVREEVVGVMEVLDKHNDETFGLDDMELLGLFAHPAAIAVEQARMVGTIGRLLVQELARLAEGRDEPDIAEAANRALTEGGTTSDQTLELAWLVHVIGQQGERSRALALQILSSVARYMS